MPDADITKIDLRGPTISQHLARPKDRMYISRWDEADTPDCWTRLLDDATPDNRV